MHIHILFILLSLVFFPTTQLMSSDDDIKVDTSHATCMNDRQVFVPLLKKESVIQNQHKAKTRKSAPAAHTEFDATRSMTQTLSSVRRNFYTLIGQNPSIAGSQSILAAADAINAATKAKEHAEHVQQKLDALKKQNPNDLNFDFFLSYQKAYQQWQHTILAARSMAAQLLSTLKQQPKIAAAKIPSAPARPAMKDAATQTESVEIKESVEEHTKKMLENCLVQKWFKFLETQPDEEIQKFNDLAPDRGILAQAMGINMDTVNQHFESLASSQTKPSAPTQPSKRPKHKRKKGAKQVTEQNDSITNFSTSLMSGKVPIDIAKLESSFSEKQKEQLAQNSIKIATELGLDIEAIGKQMMQTGKLTLGAKDKKDKRKKNKQPLAAPPYPALPTPSAPDQRSISPLTSSESDIESISPSNSRSTPMSISSSESDNDISQAVLPAVTSVAQQETQENALSMFLKDAIDNNIWQVADLLVRGSVHAQKPFPQEIKDYALFRAAGSKNKESTVLLLKESANPNTVQQDGFTPLHIACGTGDRDIVEELIKSKASINKTCTTHQEQPIHLAAHNGHKELIGYLLQQRADLSAKDRLGKTALDYFKKSQPAINTCGLLSNMIKNSYLFNTAYSITQIKQKNEKKT